MSDRRTLTILPDAQAVAHAVADLFVDEAQDAMAGRGSFRVALSGGNTPRAAYELLAQENIADQLSWSDIFVYFGDERCVPPDDEQSNYLMARKTFLDSVPIPPANIHRIPGELEPALAAAEYAKVLRADMGDEPRFDLVLLGLGPDGHTASLFPGTPPDTDNDALVRAVYAKSQNMWRVTVTPKVINAARTVAFAVEGSEKTAIFAKILEGPRDPTLYPAQIVVPDPGRLVWIVDEFAAGMLADKH